MGSIIDLTGDDDEPSVPSLPPPSRSSLPSSASSSSGIGMFSHSSDVFDWHCHACTYLNIAAKSRECGVSSTQKSLGTIILKQEYEN